MKKIVIEGEIGWDVTAEEVKNQLKGMSGDIIVEINSPGGSVFQGVSIFNALYSYDRGKITTINTGMAASMASYILLVGDIIKAYSNSIYMIHNPLTFVFGNAKDLRKNADHLDALGGLLANLYASKTEKPIEEVFKLMDNETFFYGEEMLKEGFVDEIIKIENNSDKNSAIAMFQNAYNKCLTSSKEHCKIKNYSGSIDLAAMPSLKKIVNHNSGGDMGISKEEFDAIKSKNDSLVASIKETEAKLNDAYARIENLEKAIKEKNKADVIAFCGANREIISYAKEKEFIESNATLQEVMDYALEQEKNEPSDNLKTNGDKDVETTYLEKAIAKINKGEI